MSGAVDDVFTQSGIKCSGVDAEVSKGWSFHLCIRRDRRPRPCRGRQYAETPSRRDAGRTRRAPLPPAPVLVHAPIDPAPVELGRAGGLLGAGALDRSRGAGPPEPARPPEKRAGSCTRRASVARGRGVGPDEGRAHRGGTRRELERLRSTEERARRRKPAGPGGPRTARSELASEIERVHDEHARVSSTSSTGCAGHSSITTACSTSARQRLREEQERRPRPRPIELRAEEAQRVAERNLEIATETARRRGPR